MDDCTHRHKEDSHGTYHFVSIVVVVGYFVLGQNEPPLLVVERRGLLLLLGPFDEELFQDAVGHASVASDLQESKGTCSQRRRAATAATAASARC